MSIVIDLLKKVPAVLGMFFALTQAGTRFLVCPVVVAEVYAGAFEREHKAVEALFDLCQRIDLTADTGRQAGFYAHQYANQYAKAYQGIAMKDFLLAATAHTHRGLQGMRGRNPLLTTAATQPKQCLQPHPQPAVHIPMHWCGRVSRCLWLHWAGHRQW